jgi:hypothetical protein
MCITVHSNTVSRVRAQECIAAEQVVDHVNENFVAWAGDIRYTDAYRVGLGALLRSMCGVSGFRVHPVTCCTCASHVGFDLLQLSNSLRATGYPFVGLLAFSGSRTRLVLAIQVRASI